MTTFPTGPAEYQRHTNTTITYKLLIKMRMWTDSSQWNRCIKYKMYWWLVYDASPGDRVPVTDFIFDRMKAHSPGLWMIKRELCHRFVVKKKWSIVLTIARCDLTKAKTAGKTPVMGFVDQSMFFKKLGVKTEWKNSTGGDIGDLKTGALYIVGALSYDFKVNCNAKFRVYFKSVGYQ